MSRLRLISYGPTREQEARWGPHGRFRGKLLGEAPLVARFENASIADVGLCRFRAIGALRTEPIGIKHAERYVQIILQLKETSRFERGSHSVALAPHQWLMVDDAKPCAGTIADGTEALIVMVPRTKLARNNDVLDDATMRPFPSNFGIGKIVWQFIHSVYDEVSHLESRNEPGVVDTMSNLVRLAIAEFSGYPCTSSLTQVLRHRIKAHVLMHLRDPELDLDHIAAELNCSKRYLHKAFELEGVSIWDYIWHLRLDRCRNELCDPNGSGQSITDLAFSWGFSNSAHFSTAFKERFGIPPSLYRSGSRRELNMSSAAQTRA